MKVAYLHGLESKGYGKKNDFLREVFDDVFDPRIAYTKTKGIFSKLAVEIGTFSPDVIIGSSMGGRFAYHIGNILKIDTILLNPAIGMCNVPIPIVDTEKEDTYGVHHHVLLGKNDTIILPHTTEQYLEENCYSFTIDYHNGGHRTPYELFVEQVRQHLHKR